MPMKPLLTKKQQNVYKGSPKRLPSRHLGAAADRHSRHAVIKKTKMCFSPASPGIDHRTVFVPPFPDISGQKTWGKAAE